MSSGVLPSANVSANVRAANAASAAASSTVPGRMCTAARGQSIGTSAGDSCSVGNVAADQRPAPLFDGVPLAHAPSSRGRQTAGARNRLVAEQRLQRAPQAALALDADRQAFERPEQRQVAALATGGERQRRAADLAGQPLDRQRRRADLGEQDRTTSRSSRNSSNSEPNRRPSWVPACVSRSRATTSIAASDPVRCSRR